MSEQSKEELQPTAQQLPIIIRRANDLDEGFIYNSWLRSFKNGTMAKNVPAPIYYANHHKIVDTLIHRANTLIACSSEDPSIIYGFINYEHIDNQFVLHYIYVKHIFRKLKIAESLLMKTGHDFNTLGCYTHQTLPAISKEEKFNLVYHPYLLINGGK